MKISGLRGWWGGWGRVYVGFIVPKTKRASKEFRDGRVKDIRTEITIYRGRTSSKYFKERQKINS